MTSWTIGIIAWLIPGAGHFYLEHYKRGAAILFAVLTMFILGIALGGIYFPGEAAKDDWWRILHRLHYFAGSGNGVLFLLVSFLSGTPGQDVLREAARLTTFEYGGKLIEGAGLLNYLAALDAFDLAARRKK